MEIVRKRVAEIAASYDLQAAVPADEALQKIVTIFRELRSGMTLDKKEKVKSPAGVISTAEAISLLTNSMALAASFGGGEITDEDLAAALQGAIVKDDDKDRLVWKEYLDNVMKKTRGKLARPLQRLQGDESMKPASGAGVQIFGVRHLSPAGAYHVADFLDQIKPTAVLIEGPADASPEIAHLTNTSTKPPVAILAFTEEVPVRTALWPFAVYSPEYQAMLWARKHGAHCAFIDLPSSSAVCLQDARGAPGSGKKTGRTAAPLLSRREKAA